MSPSWRTDVPAPVATTAGMRSSRAMIAGWERIPPMATPSAVHLGSADRTGRGAVGEGAGALHGATVLLRGGDVERPACGGTGGASEMALSSRPCGWDGREVLRRPVGYRHRGMSWIERWWREAGA